MAQPQALTTLQLQSYQTRIRNAGSLDQQKTAAIAVYQELYDKGYNYAGWALGVATGNTLTGTAALDYLTGTALLGIGSEACRNLSAAQIDKIRVGMADTTLTQMMAASQDTGGVLTQDLDFKRVSQAHKTVFENNGLSLTNWTLDTPMALYRKAYGDVATEQLWKQIRDTGGDGLDGVLASTQLVAAMGKLASTSTDPSIRQQAQAWMGQVPGTANWQALGRSAELVSQWLGGSTGGTTSLPSSILGEASGAAAADQQLIQGVAKYLQSPASGSNTPPPVGLGTSSRNSTALINSTGQHTVQFNSGGGVDDLWLVESKAGRYQGTREQFRVDFVASNSKVDTQTLGVAQGQTYYVPERQANGNTVYHYSNGATVTNNAVTGTYLMVVPNSEGGGQTVYSRTVDGDAGYTVRQTSTNAAGVTTYEFTGHQTSLSSEVRTLSEMTYVAPGVAQIVKDTNADKRWDTNTLNIGNVSYDLASQWQRLEAERQLRDMYAQGTLGSAQWNAFTSDTTRELMNGGTGLLPGGGGTGLQVPSNWTNWSDPIGAFYESKTKSLDAAASIASKTFRVINSAGAGMTTAQLTALDANKDGQLSGSELTGLSAWSDLNEDGVLNQSSIPATNELTTLSAALAAAGVLNLRASDYAAYTAGNAAYRTAAQSGAVAPLATRLAPIAPVAVASNYALLRATDNRFTIAAGLWIDWSASQIKISSNGQNMVGTEANDSFDVNYYSAYNGKYFNLALVQNFYAGGGNDTMGGSTRNDNLWGGTGNDTLLGYAGADRLYGEDGNDQLQGGAGADTLDGGVGDDLLFGQEDNDLLVGGLGNDELQGGSGNDQLDGGAGVDKLFGQVGDDTLVGGDGNDILMGFTASNDLKQTLLAGETDNDTLFGGAGADQMYGGLGDDYLDGGADNDVVSGGDGADVLYGAAGDDEATGGAGNDVIDGGAGADKLFGQVGNDQIWGGDGNDILMGFTASNETKQTLLAGETDNDLLWGGAGNDLVIGGLGDDQGWGGLGDDELQGGAGHDALYGEAGNDRLFGGVGNDTLYGGEGDDIILGFTAANEAQQSLGVGETDDDFLYGGVGNDTLLGGLGNDYLDGGAGADNMEGGKGNDTYTVNSVNDVILEQRDEGYDIVVSSANYILNANIEELRLVEGFNIHGTGNSLNNRIVGNSRDNILDGVTGADTMLGGAGNDTYYVDNTADQVVELAAEGIDTVNASISHALGANVENLTLLDFSKAEKGLADGVNILVYGYPKAFELDYMQGNAVAGYQGTCALTAIANLSIQANQALSEAQVVQKAIDNQWCVTDAKKTAYQRGGSNYMGQQALLSSYGVRNGVLLGYNEQAMANLIKGGRGVIIGVNAGKLWGDSAYLDNGGVNHVVTVTGVACDANTGAITGFYIADSGRGLVSDMTRYIPIADFRAEANVTNAYAIYTIEPIKLWEEDINATGNELANTLIGNRGNNVLAGGRGNDTLMGQTGDDTYMFNRGDGQDTVLDSDATRGNMDVLQLNGINQSNLWFGHVGNDLQINVLGTSDRITLKDWYVPGATGTDNQIERIKTAEGYTLHNSDIEQMVQAMASFAPPSAGQTSWNSGQRSNAGQVLIAVTH